MLAYLRRIFAHSVLYGAANVATVAAGLLLTPLYTRYFTMEEFGLASLVNAYGTLLIFVADLGLVTAFVRRYYDYEEDEAQRRRLTSTLLWVLLIVAVGVTVPLVLTRAAVSWVLAGSDQAAYLILLMTLTVGVNILLGVPLNVFRVLERPRTYLGFAVAKTIGLLVLVPTAVAGLGRGVAGAFEATLTIALLVAIAAYAATADRYALRFSRSDVLVLLSMGLGFWPTMMLGWVVDFSDVYFIRYFHGLDSVGIYSLGYRVGQIVFYAVLAFLIGWPPILFRVLKEERSGEVVARIFKYYALALATLALVVSTFSREIVGILGTPAYARAAGLVPLVAAGYFCYGLFLFFVTGALVTRRLYLQSVALGIGALVNTALNLLLIPRYEAIGAAAATLISYLIAAAAGYRFSQNVYPVPYRFGELLHIVVVAVVAFGAFHVLQNLPLPGFQSLAPLLTVGVYASLLLLTGAVTPGEARAVALLVGRPEVNPSR